MSIGPQIRISQLVCVKAGRVSNSLSRNQNLKPGLGLRPAPSLICQRESFRKRAAGSLPARRFIRGTVAARFKKILLTNIKLNGKKCELSLLIWQHWSGHPIWLQLCNAPDWYGLGFNYRAIKFIKFDAIRRRNSPHDVRDISTQNRIPPAEFTKSNQRISLRIQTRFGARIEWRIKTDCLKCNYATSQEFIRRREAIHWSQKNLAWNSTLWNFRDFVRS